MSGYTEGTPKYLAEKTWIHEGYSFNGTDPPTHDIGIGKLKKFPSPYEFQYAITQLPTKKYSPGNRVTMIGYGKDESEDYAHELMVADSKLIGVDRCYPTFVCTESGRNEVCNGDSRGPLLVRGKSPGEDVVIGIASFTFEECQNGVIGRDGFTDVYYYLDWIKDKLKR